MRAVRLFLRARAVITFVLQAVSNLEITNGERRALRKFSASWNLSLIKQCFAPRNLADILKTGQQAQSYNHGQKQLRHSPKKTCFVKRVSFSISNFDISTPSPLFNVINDAKVSTERIATLKKGERGVEYRQKRCFLKLQKHADRKRLFCSNVSALLSMSVKTVA